MGPAPRGHARLGRATAECAVPGTAGGGPLATALSSPLRVWLMRVAYADAGRDPRDLAELADAAAIEDLLLDAVVPAVFDPSLQRGAGRRSWDALAAERWLRFLAGH